MMYTAILSDRGYLSIAAAKALGVSRDAYYHWLRAEDSNKDDELKAKIDKIARQFSCYGYRRVRAQLKRQGYPVGTKRVIRLMRELGLLKKRRRRFAVTTDSSHGLRVYPNLAKDITPSGSNQLWVADITYIRLAAEFAYLAAILDAFSRRVVGWNLRGTLSRVIAFGPQDGSQGAKFWPGASSSLRSGRPVCLPRLCRAAGKSRHPDLDERTASPYENAMAESFMATLKKEEVYLVALQIGDVGSYVDILPFFT